jgi:hypothetical protein
MSDYPVSLSASPRYIQEKQNKQKPSCDKNTKGVILKGWYLLDIRKVTGCRITSDYPIITTPQNRASDQGIYASRKCSISACILPAYMKLVPIESA